MSILNIFLIFLSLGLRSFGGPVAHLGYFHHEFVEKRKWLTEAEYADLVALCQFLPGPASSQVGFGLGMRRGGYAGGVAAWCGFTLPSALLLGLVAAGATFLTAAWMQPVVHGLLVMTVAVVAQAVWGMGTKLCFDRNTRAVAVVSAAVVLVSPFGWTQLLLIPLGAVAGLLLYPAQQDTDVQETRQHGGSPLLLFGLFVCMLVVLPFAAQKGGVLVQLFDTFNRAGALVFGGGHVVLPLLEREIAGSGMMTQELFLAGYGAAQLVPGPLFTFAAFVGTAVAGVAGGIVALLGIFMSTFLLLPAVLPFWHQLAAKKKVRSALVGVNAVVVGILLAALYHPVWTKGILSATDFASALIAFAMLTYWRVPVWGVTVVTVLVSLAH